MLLICVGSWVETESNVKHLTKIVLTYPTLIKGLYSISSAIVEGTVGSFAALWF
jgi:hypothetical protein